MWSYPYSNSIAGLYEYIQHVQHLVFTVQYDSHHWLHHSTPTFSFTLHFLSLSLSLSLSHYTCLYTYIYPLFLSLSLSLSIFLYHFSLSRSSISLCVSLSLSFSLSLSLSLSLDAISICLSLSKCLLYKPLINCLKCITWSLTRFIIGKLEFYLIFHYHAP